MTYDIDKVVSQLEGMTSNWFAQKTLELLGFHVEVEKVEAKPPEPPH
jgi:hypothetical protein